MSKPEEGWTHNNAALSAGKGIYYSFPVRYIGSIQMLSSITALPMQTKIDICWEAMARCIEGGKIKKLKKRKFDKSLKKYIADSPYIKQMDLKLNMSTEGIATSELDGKPGEDIISNDSIAAISFAAGGQHELYDFVTYVAKDKRGNRYCHVFDCSILADDVLATVGQIFNILQNKVSGEDISKDQATIQQGVEDIYGVVEDVPHGAGAAHINQAYEEGDDGDAVYAEADDTQGAKFAEFLNENAQSEGLYGEAGDGDGNDIYGEGATPGWGYLDVKPDEDLYGGLADVFQDE